MRREKTQQPWEGNLQTEDEGLAEGGLGMHMFLGSCASGDSVAAEVCRVTAAARGAAMGMVSAGEAGLEDRDSDGAHCFCASQRNLPG